MACAICLEDIGSDFVILECKHKFHFVCLAENYKHRPKCPLCQGNINRPKPEASFLYIMNLVLFCVSMYIILGPLSNAPQGVFAKDSGRYEGIVVNGKPHGAGKFFFGPTVYYDGGWNNGMRQGFGKRKYSFATYEGRWHNDRQHGDGMVTYNGTFILHEGYFYVSGCPVPLVHYPSCTNNIIPSHMVPTTANEHKGGFTYKTTWTNGVADCSGIYIDANGCLLQK
jgi:hypothetical protein